MAELYLDHAATAPLEPEVLQILEAGWARSRGGAGGELAEVLELPPSQVVVTSGGTEANNLALRGLWSARQAGRRRVVAQRTEHPSVLRALERLEAEQGAQLEWLALDDQGRVDLDRALLAPDVALVSLMHANNETGVLQPVHELSLAARAVGARVHVDAVQSARFRDVSPQALGADLVTLSAHKLGGPKGVGVLYGPGVACLAPTAGVPPLLESAAARALAIRKARREREAPEVARSRDLLQRRLVEDLEGVVINGGAAPRLPGHLNASFEGVSGEAVVFELDLAGIAASAGSACSTGEPGPSHVLLELGRTVAEASASVRFSLARPLGPSELQALLEATLGAVRRLRKLARPRRRCSLG